MWFGTDDGLSRYDGYRFTVFKHDPQNPQSISSNIITDLLEDRDGMLWVATRGGGANRSDPTTQTFTSYLHHPEDRHSLSSNTILALAQDQAGAIWLGAWRGWNQSARPGHGLYYALFARPGRLARPIGHTRY